MSIEIKITDPYGTSAQELRAVASFLNQIAADMGVRNDRVPRTMPPAERVAAKITERVETVGRTSNIDPADHPDAGINPAEVFAQPGNGASGAPSFAGAAQSSIAPAAMPDSSVTVPTAPLTNVPSPAGAATTAAAPVPAANLAPGVDIDVDGLPWDARIHSSTRVKNADGRWRARRGVDDTVFDSVVAELRAVMGNAPTPAAPVSGPAVDTPSTIAAPSAPAVPPPPPVGVVDSFVPGGVHAASSIPSHELGNVPPPPPAGAQASTVAPPPVSAIASPVTVPSAPAPNGSGEPIAFPALCAKITSAIAGGTLTPDVLAAALGKHSLASLPTLAAFPHLVQPVAQELGFA